MTDVETKRMPLKGHPGPSGTISYEEHLRIYEKYVNWHKSCTPADELVFTYHECLDFLGHPPKTWVPDTTCVPSTPSLKKKATADELSELELTTQLQFLAKCAIKRAYTIWGKAGWDNLTPDIRVGVLTTALVSYMSGYHWNAAIGLESQASRCWSAKHVQHALGYCQRWSDRGDFSELDYIAESL